MENKTISNLNSKVWYRFLKVFFVLSFLGVLAIYNVSFVFIKSNVVTSVKYFNGPTVMFEGRPTWQDFTEVAERGLLGSRLSLDPPPTIVSRNFNGIIKHFLIGNLIILLIFEVIRRVFYYIVLGSIKPKK